MPVKVDVSLICLIDLKTQGTFILENGKKGYRNPGVVMKNNLTETIYDVKLNDSFILTNYLVKPPKIYL